MSYLRCGTHSTVALGLILALSGCGKEPAPPPLPGPKQLKTLQLAPPSAVAQRSFPGYVRAAERVQLSFNVPGKIIELPAVEGKKVKKGALLARLDDRNYQSRLKAAVAEFDKAEANYQRAAKLLKDDYITKAEYDQLKAAREVAAARLATARKGVSDTRLTAPFDGVVAKRIVENFTEVKAKQPVVSLEQVKNLEIVVDVPEQYVARQAEEPKVQLVARFDAFPGQEFPLKIKEYATESDPKTGAYRYVTVMQRPEELNLLPGMTATVVAERPEDQAAAARPQPFIVPISALFAVVTPEPRVWVVDDSRRVHQRKVEPGRLTGSDGIEITGGLKTGESLVIEAVNRLREGMLIEPRQERKKDES